MSGPDGATINNAFAANSSSISRSPTISLAELNNPLLKFGFYFERGITNALPPRSRPEPGTSGTAALNFGVDANNPNDTGIPSRTPCSRLPTYSEPTIRREGRIPFQEPRMVRAGHWRVNRKLSLEYGLRMYWHPPEFESADFMSIASLSRFDRSKAVRLYLPMPAIPAGTP